MGNERIQDWAEKQLHGRLIQKTHEIASVDEWQCLKEGAEALVIHAQEQAIRNNAVKAKINKIQKNGKSGCVERLMKLYVIQPANKVSWLRKNIRHD